MENAMIDRATDEYIPNGEWDDNDWEKYIAAADPSRVILSRAERIFAYSKYCNAKYKKQGGSHFSGFMLERFGMSDSQAFMWKKIGKNAPELLSITKNFKEDYTAMYEYLRLDHDIKQALLASPEKIGQKEIKDAKREAKRKAMIDELETIKAREATNPTGLYDVVVLDPPWPMRKIEREERPNQSEFDYPTMEEDELAALEIPTAENCHVWVWTTHKFLPMAMRLLDAWKLKYMCLFTWHKPGGFQPFGLPQFNCEFAIYARKGSPRFVDAKDFSTCFNAPRGAHSEKPEEFYEVVRRVTSGRRLDMFNRRLIDGFEGWGNEAK